MTTPHVLTYATRDKYQEFAERLVKQGRFHGIDVRVVLRDANPAYNYWRRCLEKVFVIRDHHAKNPGPFLWVDADSEIRSPIDWERFIPHDKDASFWTTERGTFGSGCHFWNTGSKDLLDHAAQLAADIIANGNYGPDERVWAKVRAKFHSRTGTIHHGLAIVEGYHTDFHDAPILFHRQLTKAIPQHELPTPPSTEILSPRK